MQRATAAKITRFNSGALILIALLWAAAPYGPIDAPARIMLDILAWPYGDGTPVWEPNIKWLSSISAGLLLMLGIILLGVIAPALQAGDKRVAWITLLAMCGWFVIDSAGSIASGFGSNAVFNIGLLVPICIPLLAIMRED